MNVVEFFASLGIVGILIPIATLLMLAVIVPLGLGMERSRGKSLLLALLAVVPLLIGVAGMAAGYSAIEETAAAMETSAEEDETARRLARGAIWRGTVGTAILGGASVFLCGRRGKQTAPPSI